MADRTIWSAAIPTPGPGNVRKAYVFGDAFAIATGDLALNKTVGLFKVPKGFVVTGVKAYVTDMDTNGSPAVVFSVGDAGSASRVIATSTSAQAGGSPTIADSTILGYQFTAETEILWTTTTASATAAAGTFTFYMTGYIP